MRIKITFFIISILTVFSGFAQGLTAKEIIRKADEKSRGESSQGEMTMTVVRSDWSRSVSMKVWSKGADYALILITAPPKEKGQVFLKRKTEMWNWVPTIDKMVKIPPSMMLQSWMGSDFTNDDLVKQSSLVTDYTHKIVGKEKVRGVDCYKVELIPLPEAAVVWGKINSWITVEGFDLWKSESFDEDMELVTTENASEIKKMGDRSIPSRMEIEPADKKDQKTILEITRMTFNQPIGDSFFSQQNMKKVR
jgi:outer membrane lipoprotein-sorting protein